jgi:hypothetical protein
MLAIVGTVTIFSRSGRDVVLRASANRDALLNFLQEQKDGQYERKLKIKISSKDFRVTPAGKIKLRVSPTLVKPFCKPHRDFAAVAQK